MAGAKPAAATGGKQDLEEALAQIVHQHHHQSLRQRQQTVSLQLAINMNPARMKEQIDDPLSPYTLAEKSKKDAMRSAVRVADLLVDTVDSGVHELFVNEKRIELEARTLLGTISRYRRQTDQWLAATNEINSVLKEIGDFENWMKIMDFECKSINAAIRNIHQS
ncbi:hypothetical protein EJB05_07589 [Eragrostis curvula]|uniref:Biogenesis of lysosome-related organelles complex 1 subunit 1 n=1 Tax=Eragrostis curvula TaxID=38414 RepID=A0A5J9WIT9_9POAL|nr:hypothetical protein EJB05_07589 [Eragrostis curvula]